MKRMLKYGISLLMGMILILSIVFITTSYAAQAKIIRTVIKPYNFVATGYHKIEKFPVNSQIFNSDYCYFCAQHGTPYASNGVDTTIGNINSYIVTGQRGGTTKDGDIPVTKPYLYLDKNGNLVVNDAAKPSFIDYKEAGTTPSDTAMTNWVYVEEAKDANCENTPHPFVRGNNISDSGIAFVLACFQKEGARAESYTVDPVQHAVWSWLGQLGANESNPLKGAADTYSEYHSASHDPTIDVVPEDNVGAKIDGSNTTYSVGPFDMQNYIRAKDYAFDVETPTLKSITPEEYEKLSQSEKDEYTLSEDGNYIKWVKNPGASTSNNNLQAKLLEKGSEYVGDIIKVEAIVTNGTSTKTIVLNDVLKNSKYANNTIPEPNQDDFYINLLSGDIDGYDELKSLKYTYRRVHACASGTLYKGYQEIVSFNQDGADRAGCTVYKCSGCDCDEQGHYGYGGCTSCDYDYSNCSHTCGEACKDGCTHSHGEGCKDYFCNGHHDAKDDCVCNKTSKGIHHGDTGDHQAYCEHGFKDCKQFTWKKSSNGGDNAQDALAARGHLEVEDISFEIEVDVPLKTKVELYKYISKVDHVGENINLYPQSNKRRDWTMTEKENDPVKVERGDNVFYTIELINDSRFDTRVKIIDNLPGDCTFVSDLSTDGLYRVGNDLKYRNSDGEEWITIPNHDKVVLTVVVRPTKDSGKDTNLVKYTTTNKTDPTMQYIIWGENSVHGSHSYGSIVNTYDKLEDSDTYEIKEYNVGIEKYIYDVEHNQDNIGISSIDTTLKATNSRKRQYLSEDAKKSNPVYAEFGDTITYKIIVYNTVSGTGSGFDVDRKSVPYWNPDKVYVNIEDKLPNKYSNLTVEVDMPTVEGKNAHSISTPKVESTNGGKFTITDLMVPAGGTRTVTVTLTVDEYTKATVEENNVKLIGTIENINRGPRLGQNADGSNDKHCVIKNDSDASNRITSDFYKINNYNTFMDKYIYTYDEKMQKENNEIGYTENGIITNEDGTLKTPRMNSSTTTSVVSDGNVNDTIREPVDKDKDKKNHPISAEKTETLVYSIKVSNEATIVNKAVSSGTKPATQVRTTKVTDFMQEGLQLKTVTATMYDKDGNIVTRYNANGDVAVLVSSPELVTLDGKNYNKYEFTIGNETILNPGEYIIYYVTTEIIESNMYLYDLENRAELTELTNINNTDTEERYVKTPDHNENIAKQQTSSDYIRLKDLVIAGKVWLDFDRDGYMNDKLQDESDKAYYNLNDDAMKRDVVVKLYLDDGTLLRTTKTDGDGFYTFGRTTDFGYYGTYNHDTGFSNSEIYQRVDKAKEKDEFGNYKPGSQYLNYYIEFEYDGITYKSTEYYSGMDNLNADSNSVDYGKYAMEYTFDSNAAEFKNVREDFNKKYQYISYDIAYDVNKAGGTQLTFDKTDHTSQLVEDPSRIVTARSFIKNTTRKDLVSQSENPNGWTNNVIVDKSIENTNLLWLFKHNENANSETPATEYLKYINLGLELRENIDIALTKDVYKVKTTIDGEEIEYTFNQNNGLNGEMGEYQYSSNGAQSPSTYLNDYIVSAPYGLDLYESDYKMRTEQYMADAVRKYKGLQAQSELNAEITYRITIANKSINDDENVQERKDNVKDTKLGVRISEVLDLYDENFMKVQFNETDGSMKTGKVPTGDIKAKTNSGNYNEITVKTKDEKGYLVDKNLVIGEAWYFRKIEGTTVAPENRYKLDEKSKTPLEYVDGKTTDNKPVYIQDVNGDFEKVPLTLKGKSYRGENLEYSVKENKNDFIADGYNTLYITGMEDVLIGEGEDLDIYVKYVLDKDSIEMENTNEDYAETKSTITTNVVTPGTEVTTIENTIQTTGTSTAKIDRSLKIAERILGVVSNKNTGTDGQAPNIVARKDSGRGLEGIAQINAYSVWYEDGKEASIVDMDSNAGNIGNSNSNLSDKLKDEKDTTSRKDILDQFKANKGSAYVSADEYTYYEDNTYKTGIEITADGTEWTKEQVNDKWSGKQVIIIKQNDKIIRELSGMVWDDSRTEETGSGNELQYIGNGIYSETEEKSNKAAINENIPVSYKNSVVLNKLKEKDNTITDINEKQDIKVRNVKAELVEIVEIPQGNGQSHYYEQVLTNVTWDQIQHIRTDADGKYTLSGFVPGKYVVRFTYGDTIDTNKLSNAEKAVEGIENATTDMQVFNGQDYKSTQYAYEMEDFNIAQPDNAAKVPDSTVGTIDNYATNSQKTEDDGMAIEDKTKANNDMVLTALERANLSDARDDEIRRLDVNNYSEIMVNNKAEILKGLANGTGLTTKQLKVDNNNAFKELTVNYYKQDKAQSDNSTNTAEQLKELTDNTYMNAETVEFLVKPEKLTYEQTTSNTNIYHNYIDNNDDIYYDELETIEYTTTSERQFKIQNIDMGIEYRPETEITLTKEINDVQLITSDKKLLLDLKFFTKEEADGTISHHIDLENSIGADLVQFITNKYTIDPLLDSIIGVKASEENRQGFIYIAVDEDVLQGSTVIVQYKFTAQNNSEVDRIATSLNKLRFYGNTETQDLIKAYGNKTYRKFDATGNIVDVSNITEESSEIAENQNEYTANNAARNMVYFDVYSIDGQDIEYRNRPKTMTKLENDIDFAEAKKDIDGTEGYYGKYVGYTYHTGISDAKVNANTLDIISELKFDKIIDYVDTDLDFGQLSQSNITDLENIGGENSNPIADVIDKNYTGNQYWANNSSQPISVLYDYLFKLNKSWSDIEATDTNAIEEVLTDINGVKYKSLVITTPDKMSETDENTKNQAFSKFLKTSVINKDDSIATVYLPVSKSLASEKDTDNMQYENIAEVIQFTVLTGRRTNFDTTIGNADIHEVYNQVGKDYEKYGSIEFVTAALEGDTSATETITLTPPTGLMKNRMVLYEAVNTTKNVVGSITIVIAVVVIILFVIKFTQMKMKKKRYK